MYKAIAILLLAASAAAQSQNSKHDILSSTTTEIPRTLEEYFLFSAFEIKNKTPTVIAPRQKSLRSRLLWRHPYRSSSRRRAH